MQPMLAMDYPDVPPDLEAPCLKTDARSTVIMASMVEEQRKRVPKKLIKRNKPQRYASVQYPDRLKPGDDVHDDVTAAKVGFTSMNQSVFSLIAAAGSKTNLHARFDDESSGSDTEQEPVIDKTSQAGSHKSSGDPTSSPPREETRASSTVNRSKQEGHGASRSEARFTLSLPKLRTRSNKGKNHMSESIILPGKAISPISTSDLMPSLATPRDAPIMRQMLEARAQAEPLTENNDDPANLTTESMGTEPESSSVKLMNRLKEIFNLEQPEEVISEYPCWLLQSVLLQGYMYITEKHICFYAYLAKKSNVIAKSGYLSKRGKQNPKHSRYWFTLKGDVLAYYSNPSDVYFPSGTIDLRYGISAALSDTKGKDATAFTVTTQHRSYFFKADSPTSAREWVKTLQKVIFRSHNDGDSVKVSLPIENVIDIEESRVIDFADTLKVRVVDSDETYAIDEYFFSFFSFGQDCLTILRSMINDTNARRISMDLLSPASVPDSPHFKPQMSQTQRSISVTDGTELVLHESVRATLSPTMPPVNGRISSRMSGDWSRRPSMESHPKSFDSAREISVGRASFEQRRSLDDRGRRNTSMGLGFPRGFSRSPSSKPFDPSESFIEPSTTSSGPDISNEGFQGSASQILSRSDVFRSFNIKQLALSPESLPQQRLDGSTSPLSRAHTPKNAAQISHGSRPELSRLTTTGSLDLEKDDQQQSNTTPTLQTLVKAGQYPLQRAAGWAGFLRRGSKRMSNLLATESMGYVEKVSGMWAGGRKHYSEGPGTEAALVSSESADAKAFEAHDNRFKAHFALPDSERLQATYFGYLHRVLPLYGKIYISDRYFCFRSLLPGTRTKMILPLKDIENVDKEKGFRIAYFGLVVVIQAFEELFFEFSQVEVRDDCAVTLLQSLETVRFMQESGLLTRRDKEDAELAKAEHRALQEARRLDGKLPVSANSSSSLGETPTILFDDPRASILNFRPTESLRITCLTIGSRGDVQPYIALCKGLLAEGHKPKIATHAEFEPWVRKHGIDFAPVEGDPAELMRICVENGMFTYSFLKEASVKFRGWIDELLSSAWKACQNTDILLESPSAMAGIHIAEALGIPYFRAFTMPWTRTRAYPHAFAVPEHKMGGAYNYVSYVMFDNVFWAAIAGQVNRWRKKELSLRSTNLDKLHPNKVPFLYNFSPSVVVPPLDYSDWIRVTGYWFLDEASDWTPPADLSEFIKKARADKKKLVYIGFGSIVVADPVTLTKTIVDSVIKADLRCILSKGWSDRLGNKDATVPEVPLPPEIHQIKSVPHDWMFKQIDAAAHHGGAGTTGASLRAGIPTIIKPFFGDQFFFGSRVEDLGVGICMKKLNVSVFSRALWEATHSERMIVKAKVLGEQIQQENGVATAIQAIYRDLEYAKSLIKNRNVNADNDVADEESWTFIGDESDPELTRRIAEWDQYNHPSLDTRKGSAAA